jgi:hypothetical protein
MGPSGQPLRADLTACVDCQTGRWYEKSSLEEEFIGGPSISHQKTPAKLKT